MASAEDGPPFDGIHSPPGGKDIVNVGTASDRASIENTV